MCLLLCVIQNEFVCSYNRHMNDLAKQPSKTANKLIVDRLAKKKEHVQIQSRGRKSCRT